MKRPWIYVASPYTKGDPAINVNFQCRVFDQLMDEGLVYPYMPLWSHFQHTLYPRPYKDWTDYDNAIIERLDGCLRLDASHADMGYVETRSSGADAEVALFQKLGKPVFTKKEDLYLWVKR